MKKPKPDRVVRMRVGQLRVGDQVDLCSCPIMGEKDGWWIYEWATIGHIERETPHCICVYYDGASDVGYWPDQELRVKWRSNMGKGWRDVSCEAIGEPECKDTGDKA